MPPVIEGAPWLANMILLAMAVLSPVLVAVVTRRKLDETKRAVGQAQRTAAETQQTVGEVRDQVANSHDTNLRDDLDDLRDGLDAHGESIHRIERHVGDVAHTVRALERSHDRRYQLQEKALADAVEDHHRDIREIRDQIRETIEKENEHG